MDVTYYVALAIVLANDGLAPGEAVECTSAHRRRDPRESPIAQTELHNALPPQWSPA